MLRLDTNRVKVCHNTLQSDATELRVGSLEGRISPDPNARYPAHTKNEGQKLLNKLHSVHLRTMLTMTLMAWHVTFKAQFTTQKMQFTRKKGSNCLQSQILK